MKPKVDIMRSLDGQLERWVWVEGKKNPYVCETHDETIHFIVRACEMGLNPRLETFLKAVA